MPYVYECDGDSDCVRYYWWKEQPEMKDKLPPCAKRKCVDGIEMCYAIGCCEIGDMPCECWCCPKKGTEECSALKKKGAKK